MLWPRSRWTTWSAYRLIGDVKCVYTGSARPVCIQFSSSRSPEQKYAAGLMSRVHAMRTTGAKFGSEAFQQPISECCSASMEDASNLMPCCASASTRALKSAASGFGWQRSRELSGKSATSLRATVTFASTMSSSMSECVSSGAFTLRPRGRLDAVGKPSASLSRSKPTSAEASSSAPSACRFVLRCRVMEWRTLSCITSLAFASPSSTLAPFVSESISWPSISLCASKYDSLFLERITVLAYRVE
mmetsp:Transcript_58429/g.126910  ORF Transcript_58429/g.126910 Transcript_58429/m.126910 type:complete len:246 (-) Transcript_58429:427-1164(-)